MVRLFIGFMMPEEMKNYINRIQKSIDANNFEGKFVEKENLHISLSFLGERPEENLMDIKRNLDEIATEYEKFSVVVSNIKLIPNETYVRVVALEIEDENKILEQMGKEIVKKIGGDSKPPHITLFRVRKIKDRKKFMENVQSLDFGKMEIEIDKMDLVKSELRRGGPIYSVLYSSPLK